MLVTLLALALFAPTPAQPDTIDITKVISVTDYGPNQLLLAMPSNTFLVVRKDAITFAASTITVPTSSVMMSIVGGETPPIVLKSEWFDVDNMRFEIVLNCATYTSFTACMDAFDNAVDAMKKKHKPKPTNWLIEIDKSKTDPK